MKPYSLPRGVTPNSVEHWDTLYAHYGDAGVRSAYELFQYPLAVLPNAGSVLEVGCGSGDFAVLCARERPALAFVGLDLSPVAIDIARRRVPTARFVCGSILNGAPFGDRQFDVAVSIEVIEHFTLDETTAVLAALKRVAGRVVLTTPRDTQPDFQHVTIFDRESFARLDPAARLTEVPGHWLIEIGGEACATAS